MTLLTICQDAAKIIGITAPSAVTSSTDTSVIQLEACVNQEGRAQVRKYEWEVLTKEGSHTTIAAESQGAVTSIASDWGGSPTIRFGTEPPIENITGRSAVPNGSRSKPSYPAA